MNRNLQHDLKIAVANTLLGDLSQPKAEEMKLLYESMNAELDKQIELDMQELNNILHKNDPVVSPPPPHRTFKPKAVNPAPPKNIIERLGLQISDDDVDRYLPFYQSMNAELDKQIAKDREQIRNYISKTDGKMDLARRNEFFHTIMHYPHYQQPEPRDRPHFVPAHPSKQHKLVRVHTVRVQVDG